MKFWVKLQHWFYRMLIDYKTKKIIEFNKERENYLKKQIIMKNDFVDPKMMHKSSVYCMEHGGPKDCFGLLHNISFNLYDTDGNELTDENIYTAKVHFKCRCDKCGHEVLLTFDPDIPTILY